MTEPFDPGPRLPPDSPPPDDEVALGPEADQEAVARTILLDQLTGSARSRSELSTRLARKGVPDTLAERLLDRFEEVGLVDDPAFARAWVQSRQRGKGLARRALAHELRRKGVDEEVARSALDEVGPDDEVRAARTLVRRRLARLGGLDRDTAVRRLTGMLARKGYPASVCFRVVREELEALGHSLDHSMGEDTVDLS
jgi:regulatory protein